MSRNPPWAEVQVFLDRDGINQQELAAKTGLSKTYLSNLITGYRTPSARAIQCIANALRVPQTMIIPASWKEDAA